MAGLAKALVVDTPEGIRMFKLLSLRASLKMECLGLMRRGRSALAITKELLGLKKSCKREEALALLEQAIAGCQRSRV